MMSNVELIDNQDDSIQLGITASNIQMPIEATNNNSKEDEND